MSPNGTKHWRLIGEKLSMQYNEPSQCLANEQRNTWTAKGSHQKISCLLTYATSSFATHASTKTLNFPGPRAMLPEVDVSHTLLLPPNHETHTLISHVAWNKTKQCAWKNHGAQRILYGKRQCVRQCHIWGTAFPLPCLNKIRRGGFQPFQSVARQHCYGRLLFISVTMQETSDNAGHKWRQRTDDSGNMSPGGCVNTEDVWPGPTGSTASICQPNLSQHKTTIRSNGRVIALCDMVATWLSIRLLTQFMLIPDSLTAQGPGATI